MLRRRYKGRFQGSYMGELETPKGEREAERNAPISSSSAASHTSSPISFTQESGLRSRSWTPITSAADNWGNSQRLDGGWGGGEWLAPFLLAWSHEPGLFVSFCLLLPHILVVLALK